MTVLRIFRRHSMNIGFECSGHSGYGEAGTDIVCAAISTAAQFCVQCGERIDHIQADFIEDPARAMIRCVAKKPNVSFSAHIDILKELGETISKDYSDFFNLEIVEV